MHLSTQDINLEYLSAYFHMPINAVAKEIGVCATVLKKICRRNGIPRWPHRKIKSLDKMIANLENTVPKNKEEEIKISKEIASIKKKKNFLIKNPNILGMKNQNHLINLCGSLDSGSELDGHSIHPTSLLIDSLINSGSSDDDSSDNHNFNFYSPQLSSSPLSTSTLSSPSSSTQKPQPPTFSPNVNFLTNQQTHHHNTTTNNNNISNNNNNNLSSVTTGSHSPKTTPLQSPLFIGNQAPPPTSLVTQAPPSFSKSPVQKQSNLLHLLNDTEYEITLPKLNIPQSFVEAPLKTLEPSFLNKTSQSSSSSSSSSPPQSPTQQSQIFSQSQINNFVHNKNNATTANPNTNPNTNTNTNPINNKNNNFFNSNNNTNYKNFKSYNDEYPYIQHHYNNNQYQYQYQQQQQQQQYQQPQPQYHNSLSKNMFHKNDFESSFSRADLNNAMAVMVMATLMNSSANNNNNNSDNSNNNNNNNNLNTTRNNTSRLNRIDFTRVVPAVIQNNNISFDDQL